MSPVVAVRRAFPSAPVKAVRSLAARAGRRSRV